MISIEANQLVKNVNLIEIPFNLISVVTPSGLKSGILSIIQNLQFQLITKLEMIRWNSLYVCSIDSVLVSNCLMYFDFKFDTQHILHECILHIQNILFKFIVARQKVFVVHE